MATQPAGAGTASDPYLVTTYDELDYIHTEPGAYYQLQNDIDASVALWSPVDFSGTLDGNGYTIDSWEGDSYGLLGTLTGTVFDLKVTNLYVSYGGQTGGLTASIGDSFAPTALIYNCEIGGTVDLSSQYGGGLGSQLTQGSVIANCVVDMDVNNSAADTGAIVGRLFEGYCVDCHTTGTVTGNTETGGVVGENRDTVLRCSTDAYVESNGDDAVTGGITGLNAGELRKCYATNEVRGNSGDYVGGIAGIHTNDNTLSRCYSTAKVTTANDNAGGLVGWSDDGQAVIEYSYAAGLVSADFGKAGGLLGVTTNGPTIQYCYWDTEATGEGDAIHQDNSSTTTELRGLTTDEMQGFGAQYEMLNFDFNAGPWLVRSDPDDYPTLDIDPGNIPVFSTGGGGSGPTQDFVFVEENSVSVE